MYLADYHTHSTCSDDGHNTMTEMAAAALSAGLHEILPDGSSGCGYMAGRPGARALLACCGGTVCRSTRGPFGSRIKIQLGVELGQATEDVSRANRFLDDAPPLTLSSHRFIICLGNTGAGISAPSKKQTKFLPAVPSVNTWMKCWLWPGGGRFSVLGHLTLPLRHFNENLGMHMTFKGFEEQVAEIFKCIIPAGRGIELNTNRGHTPLPDEPILRLYRFGR